MIVHQIYGLFDDGKPLEDNVLFNEGSKRWREFCINKGHKYMLWDKEMIYELVNTYTEVKEYFYSVRHPVMKCDIARMLILYQFGGMYVDLDVHPFYNMNFMECENMIESGKLYLSTYKYHKDKIVDDKDLVLDIEVIMTKKYNKILYEWLKEIPKVIEEKNKISVYNEWVIRYIFYTTGPHAFRKFLKSKGALGGEWSGINVVSLNETYKFGDLDNIDLDQLINPDGSIKYYMISYHSLSYSPHKKKVKYSKKKKKSNEKKVEISEKVDILPEVEEVVENIVEAVIEEVQQEEVKPTLNDSNKLEDIINLLDELVCIQKKVYNL